MATQEALLGAGQNSGESFFHLSRLTGIATKPQVLQWGVRLTGAALILVAAHVVFSEKNNAQAESNLSKNPTTLQGIENPYSFSYRGNSREWTIGEEPGILPNETSELFGTIYDRFNKNPDPTFKIQPQEPKYPPRTQRGPVLPIGAVGADTIAGCGGMQTDTLRADGNLNPYYESIRSLDNPTDYSDGAREVTPGGPIHGIISMQGFILGIDANGGMVRVLFSKTVDPMEAGWWRAQRYPNSCRVRGPFVQEILHKLHIPAIFKGAWNRLQSPWAAIQYATLLARV